MNSMRRDEDMTLKGKPLRPVGAQNAGEEQRNYPRRNEEAEPKWKRRPTVNVSGGESPMT